MKKVKLTDLISVEALQQIQDGFSRYTGMAALTTDADGVPVTRGSGFTRFCMEMTRKSKKGCHNCEECDKNGALLTLNNGHATVYDCHAGLTDFAAPIMVEGNFIGSFIGGQVRTADVDEDKMEQTALEYGLDPKEYIEAAKEATYLTDEEVEKAAVFLEEIAASLSSLAYRNYVALQESKRMENAAKSQTKFVMSITTNIERSMDSWMETIQKAIDATGDEKVRELLVQVKNEGYESRANIRDVVDYVRMSAKKVEIEETDYRVEELAQQIKKGIADYVEKRQVGFSIVIDKNVPEHLFGDAGRIGQLVNKVLRILLNKKKEGEMVVHLSTYQVSYATMLRIDVTDIKSNLSEKDRKVLRANAADNNRENAASEDEKSLGISLARLLRRNMSGTFYFEENGGDVVMRIDLPQLGLGGNH